MNPISPSVQHFLLTNINAVDQLEILRRVAAEPQTEFASSTLAKELQIPAEDLEPHLKTLTSRGLLAITANPPLTCRYQPKSPEMDAQVQALLKTYLERPVSLIKMVYENQKQLRLFADAFRLKKEE